MVTANSSGRSSSSGILTYFKRNYTYD